MVEPPCEMPPASTLARNARTMPRALTPSWIQKPASSTARIADTTWGGTSCRAIGWRFSSPWSVAITEPSAAYT
jgi:hypothetical protein